MPAETSTRTFVGLRPFRTEESLLFFGRRQQISELLDRLHASHFLAVIGSSGCGKSSLIRAGLIPRLSAGFLVEDRDDWTVATMTPGEAPLARLAECFELTRKTLSEEGATAIVDKLSSQPDAAARSCLLLVDQFEEIFRFAVTPEQINEAADMVSILLSLSTQRSFPVFVVITMRSDFLGDCDRFYGLPEALNRSHYLVPRLTRQQRRESIEGPIRLAGQTVTGQLVDRVLNDLGDELDQLPVMQHVMLRTWEHWERRGAKGPLDVDDYTEVGGAQEALARDAESAMDGLSDADRQLTAQMFQALTDVDASNRRIRRPVRLSTLEAITGASRSRIVNIIDRFRGGDRSFLSMQPQPGSNDALVDISHESLIRQWATLRKWADEEAESKRIYLDYLVNAVQYHQSLLRDSNLQVALDWREKRQPTAAWAQRYDERFYEAMKFLDESRDVATQEAKERARMEKRVRVMTGVVFVGAVLAVVGFGYGNYANKQASTTIAQIRALADSEKQQADETKRLADEYVTKIRRESDETKAKADNDVQEANDQLRQAKSDTAATIATAAAQNATAPEIKGVLALEAMSGAHDSAEVRSILMNALQALPPRSARHEAHKGRVGAVAASADGRWLATGGSDSKVLLWEVARQSVVRNFDAGAPVTSLLFSPEGTALVVITRGKTLVLNTNTLMEVMSIDRASAAAFRPDGKEFTAVVSYGLKRFDTSASPWREVDISLALSRPRAIAYDSAGLVLIADDDSGRSAIYRGTTRVQDSGDCTSIRMDGDDILAACLTNAIRFPAGSKELQRVSTEARDVGATTLPKTDPDDKFGQKVTVAMTRLGSRIQVFRDDDGTAPFLQLPDSYTAFAVPPQGNWLATGNGSGAVAFWKLESAPLASVVNFQPPLADLTFSHDEKWLALAGDSGEIAIVDTSNAKILKTFRVNGPLERPLFNEDDSLLALLGPNELQLVQTGTWTKLPADIKSTREDELSFTFSKNSKILLVAQSNGRDPGSLKRYSTHPLALLSTNPIPPRSVVDVTRDKEWIRLTVTENTRAGRRTVTYLKTETGQGASESEIPEEFKKPERNDGDDVEEEYDPTWVGLLPRDDTGLSGDARGGAWAITGDVVDIATGQSVFAFPDAVMNYAISRKGSWIATKSTEERILLWPFGAEALKKRACEILPRNLTVEEWKKFDLGQRRATCPNLP